MSSLNKVMLIGRLGRDPELRHTQQGKAVCNFSMATDESYKDRDGNKVDKAEWHDIVVWDRSGENCANYLAKGSLVYVEGRLQTRKWQDQQGNERKTKEVVAERVQFLDTKSQQHGDGQQEQRQQPRQQQQASAQARGRGPRNMDDVPF